MILSCITVWGLTTYSIRVSLTEARVINIGVGVFWDKNCDNPVSILSWGKIVFNPLNPQLSKNVTFYIQNQGDELVTLFLNTSEWDPPIVRRHVNLNWDYNGQALRTKEIVEVTLFLSVSSSLWFELPRIQNYNFNIIISARTD